LCGLTRRLGWSRHPLDDSVEPILQIANAADQIGHLVAQISRERIRPHDGNNRHDENRNQHSNN